MPPFVDAIKQWIKSLSFYLTIPPNISRTILFPVIFIYENVSNLSLDLKALSVTCEGAKVLLVINLEYSYYYNIRNFVYMKILCLLLIGSYTAFSKYVNSWNGGCIYCI